MVISSRVVSIGIWNKSVEDYQEFLKRADARIKMNAEHGQNIKRILRFLAFRNKTATTWDFRRECFSKFRDKEGETMARRILCGRTDRGKRSVGLVDLGIVSKIIDKSDPSSSASYELTLYGLLYAIRVCDFSNKELFKVARNHPEMIPYVFGKADYLESKHVNLEPLRIIANGEIRRFESSMLTSIPYHDLLSFLLTEYLERWLMPQDQFVNFISLWFYTYLMLASAKKNRTVSKKWAEVMWSDDEIVLWYGAFMSQASEFYEKRSNHIRALLKSSGKWKLESLLID